MGESAVKYRLCRCRCRCRCKINNLMGEDTGTSILFILHGPPALLTPFSPPGLLSSDPYPALACPLGPILLPSFAQTSASPKRPAALGPFSASKIASDAHPIASDRIRSLAAISSLYASPRPNRGCFTCLLRCTAPSKVCGGLLTERRFFSTIFSSIESFSCFYISSPRDVTRL